MSLLTHWQALDEAERRARLRSLRALVRVIGGGEAAAVEDAIAAAEADIALLTAADRALDRLPSITLRRVLSTFAATLPKHRHDR